MRERFDRQLEQLHVELIKMGSLCEQGISLSCQALREGQTEITNKVFTIEDELDKKEREVENLCLQLFLQQQPVAKDLRIISAAMKLISDMERIGDQAADIMELAPYIAGGESKSKIHISEMADAASRMVTDSVEAFVKSDLALARKVMEADDVVDGLFLKIKDELTNLIHIKDVEAGTALDLFMAAKYFERIGDHAVNIAEWVEFSITGVYKGQEL